MKSRPDIEQKVLETLDSLEGIQRAEPRPFFYTRLIGRMQQGGMSVWEKLVSIMARPMVAVAGLCFILLLNIFLLSRQDDTTTSGQGVVSSNESVATDNDYIFASSSFDYENLDQQ